MCITIAGALTLSPSLQHVAAGGLAISGWLPEHQGCVVVHLRDLRGSWSLRYTWTRGNRGYQGGGEKIKGQPSRSKCSELKNLRNCCDGKSTCCYVFGLSMNLSFVTILSDAYIACLLHSLWVI